MNHLNTLKGMPFVEVDGDKLTVKIQDGTVSERGFNGLQIHEMITLIGYLFTSLNDELPCRENDDTLYYLARAYSSQLERISKGN